MPIHTGTIATFAARMMVPPVALSPTPSLITRALRYEKKSWWEAVVASAFVDATWSDLARRWDDAQLVELLVVAGFYRLVSGFLNSTGVQLDDGIPGFPTTQ